MTATTSTSAIARLASLEDHFRSMEDQATLRMDCLCLIASGNDNAGATLGWEETEEFAALAIRSIQGLLGEMPSEIQAAFKSAGVTF
jgi:hypothetical protein